MLEQILFTYTMIGKLMYKYNRVQCTMKRNFKKYGRLVIAYRVCSVLRCGSEIATFLFGHEGMSECVGLGLTSHSTWTYNR